MPELAIIIVNYNTRDLLRACLTDLKRHVATLDATITVVDNGSSDGSTEVVRGEFPEVSLIASKENLGFARANNKALEATDSDFVLLLNSDAFLCDGALERLRSVVDNDEQIAAVGPRMFDRNGALLASVHRFESLAKLAATAFGLHELLPRCLVRSATYLCGRAGKLHRLNRDATAPVDVDWISGACMMVRRSAIVEVGSMDERYFMYMED
ncbi:MAG: glycosyltransferase family 2 protein, partial [Armatimonadetes bacterium]|nr:glycosyltransferase family 2 protein [Armatimonadota bacterium]